MSGGAALGSTALRVLLAVVAFAGPATAGAQEAVAVRDSGGVRIVSLPSAPPSPAEGVAARVSFTTEGHEELFRVTSAVFLPDGTLAVANAGTSEILFFNRDGERIRRYGREGEGPGEFTSIRAVGLTTEGKLWAYDDRQGRLTEIPGPGEAPGTRPIRPSDPITSLQPLTVDWDGPVLGIRAELRIFKMSGESRDTVPLFVIHSEDAVDTLGYWPGLEKTFTDVGNGAAQLRVGFGRSVYTGASAHRAVIGSSDSLDLSVYDSTGRLEARIVGGGPTVPVTERAAEKWRRERAAAADNPAIAKAYGEVRVHSTYPVFDGLGIDPDGDVWVGFDPAGGETQAWWVVGRQGPERLITIPGGGTLLAVDGDHLAVLRRTELGEEYVVVYRTELEADDEGGSR